MESHEKPIELYPASFSELEDASSEEPRENGKSDGNGWNIESLIDVPLQVTVELGRTEMPIRDVLSLGPGALIELDKLAGDPVDILVNDRPIAHGEVVVIDNMFGVRVTDIIPPAQRDRFTR